MQIHIIQLNDSEFFGLQTLEKGRVLWLTHPGDDTRPSDLMISKLKEMGNGTLICAEVCAPSEHSEIELCLYQVSNLCAIFKPSFIAGVFNAIDACVFAQDTPKSDVPVVTGDLLEVYLAHQYGDGDYTLLRMAAFYPIKRPEPNSAMKEKH